MDTEKIETGVTTSDSTAPEMPRSDVMFISVPAGGFDATQIQKYIRAGYALWGTVKMVAPKTAGDLILPDGMLPAPVEYLVLKLDVNAVPVNLLAHHLVKARNDKGGINQVAETFFGMTIGALERGLNEARGIGNGR